MERHEYQAPSLRHICVKSHVYIVTKTLIPHPYSRVLI